MAFSKNGCAIFLPGLKARPDPVVFRRVVPLPDSVSCAAEGLSPGAGLWLSAWQRQTIAQNRAVGVAGDAANPDRQTGVVLSSLWRADGAGRLSTGMAEAGISP